MVCTCGACTTGVRACRALHGGVHADCVGDSGDLLWRAGDLVFLSAGDVLAMRWRRAGDVLATRWQRAGDAGDGSSPL